MSFSIHFALSNFGAAAADGAGAVWLEALNIEAVVVAVVVEAVELGKLLSTAAVGEEETVETAADVVSVCLAGPAGEEKKEVMDAFALGFLAVEVARSAALRLSGVVMIDVRITTQKSTLQIHCEAGRSKSSSSQLVECDVTLPSAFCGRDSALRTSDR